MLYIYYRYIDKFHLEPVEWRDLFEFMKYNKIDVDINSYLIKSAEGGK